MPWVFARLLIGALATQLLLVAQLLFMVGLLMVGLFMVGKVYAETDSSLPRDCAPSCVAVGEWSFAVGLGIGKRTNPVVGHDDVPIYLVPEVSYYGEKFFIENLDFGYTLANTRQSQFNLLMLTPGFEHVFFSDALYNRIGADDLQAGPIEGPEDGRGPSDIPGAEQLRLPKRRMAGMSGFEYIHFFKYLEFHLQALGDISGVHHGEKVRVAVSLPLNKERHSVLLTTGLTYQSSQLLNYYYGLQSDTINHDVNYEVGDGVARYFRADWRYKINKSWMLRAILSYKKLDSQVAASPIVVDDDYVTYFVGGVYHF